MNPEAINTGGAGRFRLAVLLPLLGAALLWASWPSICDMVRRWSYDARYSHGYLVPVFSLFLLWHRRAMLASKTVKTNWWGLALIVAGEALRLAGARYYIDWFMALAMIPTLGGIVLLVGGWSALRWAWPAIAFLFFMMPLPYRIELALGYPLQRISTLASNYTLQTIGLPAVAEGNVILLDHARIGVVEACNGLGMLFMFLAFTVGTTLILERSLVDKILIVLSTVPIALGANIARITVTALLHETVGSRVADVVYHDLAGWLMMPLALAALWTELFLLSCLFIEQLPEQPVPLMLLPDLGIPAGPGRQRSSSPPTSEQK